MNTGEVEIIHFSDEYRQSFKELNYEWIQKLFWVEPGDEYVLSNPEEAIIQKGGYIYFARFQGKIVGTFSLYPVEENTLELGKMAVRYTYQNKGIGKLLMKTAIAKGRSLHVSRIVLYSNTSLCNAINMYISFGFRLIPKTDFHLKRSNIKMELKLT